MIQSEFVKCLKDIKEFKLYIEDNGKHYVKTSGGGYVQDGKVISSAVIDEDYIHYTNTFGGIEYEIIINIGDKKYEFTDEIIMASNIPEIKLKEIKGE